MLGDVLRAGDQEARQGGRVQVSRPQGGRGVHAREDDGGGAQGPGEDGATGATEAPVPRQASRHGHAGRDARNQVGIEMVL